MSETTNRQLRRKSGLTGEYPTVVAEPFSELDEILVSVGENKTHLISVGDQYNNCLPTYLSPPDRLPAKVVKIYNSPRGLPGGKYEVKDGHKCIPTIQIKFQIPDESTFEHLDGTIEKVENFNAPYVLGLTIPDWEKEKYGTVGVYE